MDWITTSTLLEDLGDSGNDAAWERFVSRFRIPIVRFARHLGMSEADAEDVAQETLTAFATAYRNGQYDRAKGRLSRWLFGIAYHSAVDEQRNAARRAKLVAPAEGTSFWAQVPDEQTSTRVWEEQWEQALIEQCLERVRREVEPATMRAFELVMQDRTPAEAAQELGVAVKAVYNAKYTVLKRLRDLRADLENLA